MQYIQVVFTIPEEQMRELMIATLSEVGFEGFEETSKELYAYINEQEFDEEQLQSLATTHGLSYNKTLIPQQNWNVQWEENFQPVIVEGFCTVRADFHTMSVNTPYEVIITPKMSFGTGHHATTQLMMKQMQQLHFANTSVLDFGTGTGILAILAEKLGAGKVTAIDNDEWSYENTKENAARNNCTTLDIALGTLEQVSQRDYDIILANINRHILLQYMEMMFLKLVPGGKILMSGILKEDRDIVVASAEQQGFKFVKSEDLNNWMVLLFTK